ASGARRSTPVRRISGAASVRWEGSWAPDGGHRPSAGAKLHRKITIDVAFAPVNDSPAGKLGWARQTRRYSPLNKGFRGKNCTWLPPSWSSVQMWFSVAGRQDHHKPR